MVLRNLTEDEMKRNSEWREFIDANLAWIRAFSRLGFVKVKNCAFGSFWKYLIVMLFVALITLSTVNVSMVILFGYEKVTSQDSYGQGEINDEETKFRSALDGDNFCDVIRNTQTCEDREEAFYKLISTLKKLVLTDSTMPCPHRNKTTRKLLTSFRSFTNSESETTRVRVDLNEAPFPLSSRPLVPHCERIFSNLSLSTKHKNNLKKLVLHRKRTDREFIDSSKDCQAFRLIRGFIYYPLSDEESKFPIAYSILVYKNVWQFERLLRAIYSPQNYYCIHVDRKASEVTVKAFEILVKCFKNVFLSSRRESVLWGSVSVLDAELNCMRDLWRYGDWRYFINLTGQEFPLVSNRQLVRALKAFNGANDIDGSVIRARKVAFRFKYFHSQKAMKKTNLRMPPAPHKIDITKGNVHMIASRAYIDFIIHHPVALDFYDWAKETNFPEEIFFSSLNYNPHLGVAGTYKGKTREKDLHKNVYIARYKHWIHEWPFNEYGKCHGKNVRGICVIGIGDLPRLKMRKELFVNKFFDDFEPLALDCIEELQFNRTKLSKDPKFTFDDNFYKNLDFVKNKV